MRSPAPCTIPTPDDTGEATVVVVVRDWSESATKLNPTETSAQSASDLSPSGFSSRDDSSFTNCQPAIAARRRFVVVTAQASLAMNRYLSEPHPLPARGTPARSAGEPAISSSRSHRLSAPDQLCR
jgi:hypothetical protein